MNLIYQKEEMRKFSLDNLNPVQLEAVTHKDGPLLIVAGPGTGKTNVIVSRICHLVLNEGVNPESIVALTFTEKAAQEMQERLDIEMPYGFRQPFVSTIHSFCDKILREFALDLGLSNDFKLLSQAEQWMLIRRRIFELPLDYLRPLTNPNKFISALVALFSRAKDETIGPEEYQNYVNDLAEKAKTPAELSELKKQREIALIYQAYEKWLAEENALDFGGLQLAVLQLFKKRPNILKILHDRYRYILVDEFQDTNYAQYHLLKLLAKTDGNITVVGDDDQAIYRFRGASVQNLVDFEKTFKNPKVVVLNHNYRSRQEIVDLAYKVIQFNNPDRLEFQAKINKKLTAERKRGAKIEILHLTTDDDEAEEVLDKIKEILNSNPNLSYKDIVILSRTNAGLDRFATVLRREGLPFQRVSGGGLFQAPEVRDLIAYLKILADPFDDVSFYRVLSIASFEIAPQELIKLSRQAKEQKQHLYDLLKQNFGSESLEAIHSLLSLFEKHLADTKSKSCFEIALDFLSRSGIIKNLIQNESVSNNLSLGNLNLFCKKIKDFELETAERSVRSFIEYLDFLMEAGEDPAGAEIEDIDVIKLMTVHAAKGLEFPVVFLTGLSDGKFPCSDRSEPLPLPDALYKELLPSGDAHLEEERRLFFVGLTRARDQLYLSYADYYGRGVTRRRPSVFLVEAFSSEIKNDLPKQRALTLFNVKAPVKKEAIFDYLSALNNLSYSHLEAFERCPLMFKYQYIYKIPTKTTTPLALGQSCHRALKDFYESWIKSGVKGSEKTLLEILEKNWIPEGYADQKQMELAKAEAKTWLENYYENEIKKSSAPPKFVEKRFCLQTSDLPLKGVIDRVDETADGYEIIDYKTGKEEDEHEVKKNRQLSLYALACVREFGTLPKAVSLYFLKSGKKVSSTRTHEELENTLKEVEKEIQDIKKGEFPPKSSEATCGNCPYKLICPEWESFKPTT